MTFGLWCQTTGSSRQDYASLLEVFNILNDIATLKTLPRTIIIIKKYVKEQLPLMKLQRQEIPVVLN